MPLLSAQLRVRSPEFSSTQGHVDLIRRDSYLPLSSTKDEDHITNSNNWCPVVFGKLLFRAENYLHKHYFGETLLEAT